MILLEKKLAAMLARQTVALTSADNKKEAVIAYGYELMITSFIGILWLIVCSVVCKLYLAWIPFLLGFAPLRTTAGGYHAPTHGLCYLVTTSVYCCCLIIAKSNLLSHVHILAIAVVSALLVYLFSPVAANNKPLSKVKQIRNRRQSLVCCLVLVLLSVILCLMKYADAYTTLLILGAAAASGSLIAAKIINSFWKGDAL